MSRSTESKPRVRGRRRGRRALIGFAAVLVLAYGALWVVRLTRDYPSARVRAFLRSGSPLVIAHRGASAELAEHSVAAYRLALAAGADVLELDVHRAKDGALVIAHDRDLSRALGVSMVVAEHDLAELRRAVAAAHPGGDPAALLPTLDEVMAAFPEVRLNLELKDDTPLLARAVAEAITRHQRDWDGSVLVVSFHAGALREFRRASGGRVATAASAREVAGFLVCYVLDVPCRPDYEALQVPLAARASWPRLRFDQREFVAFAHRHGLAVHYWTIDDPAEMRRLFDLGADGIMTNRPDLAVQARNAWDSEYVE